MSTDERYFDWLLSLISMPTDPDISYYELCRRMHQTAFYWIMENDDNRALDGIGLRVRFNRENGYSVDEEQQASVLEVIVALADRMNYAMADDEEEDRTGWFFTQILRSIGIFEWTDSAYLEHIWDGEGLDRKLEKLLSREYKRTGEGGFFHLKKAKFDVRKVEIWYQM